MVSIKRRHYISQESIPYPAVVVGRCALYNRAYEEGLVTVEFFLSTHNTETQTARRAPAEDNVFTAV